MELFGDSLEEEGCNVLPLQADSRQIKIMICAVNICGDALSKATASTPNRVPVNGAVIFSEHWLTDFVHILTLCVVFFVSATSRLCKFLGLQCFQQ